MMAKWPDLNTRARELADRERRLYDQRTIPAVLEELAAENEALRAERNAWKETAAMHLDAEQAFLSWLRQAGEHMRAEGITVCDDGQDCGEILTAKVPECAALLKQRADAAEAEAARLRAEAENSAAQRDEAVLRAEVAEEAKRAVEADFGAPDEEWQNDEVLSIAAGRKDDSGKAPHHLIAPEIQDALAQVLDFGARKYAPRNWERGMAWSRPFSALMRHMWAWWRGEDQDAETGLSHLHHAACCLMFLIAYEARRTGEDDRPRAEPARIRSDRQKGEAL